MLLTVSKRLEFSASRRLHVARWSDNENLAAFGPETNARFGSGRNYVAYFVFTGPVDPNTGMLINISEIKERAGTIVRQRFDHKFLNEDNPSFRNVPPTAEHVAQQLPLVRYDAIDDCVRALQDELDHRYLNEDVPGMANRPMTTESLAEYIYQRASSMAPLDRVRLHEREAFFAEVWKNSAIFLG